MRLSFSLTNYNHDQLESSGRDDTLPRRTRNNEHMAPAFIEFNRRLRWADADAAGRLHFPRIFEIYQLFDTGEELAIEGTTTVVV